MEKRARGVQRLAWDEPGERTASRFAGESERSLEVATVFISFIETVPKSWNPTTPIHEGVVHYSCDAVSLRRSRASSRHQFDCSGCQHTFTVSCSIPCPRRVEQLLSEARRWLLDEERGRTLFREDSCFQPSDTHRMSRAKLAETRRDTTRGDVTLLARNHRRRRSNKLFCGTPTYAEVGFLRLPPQACSPGSRSPCLSGAMSTSLVTR